jgi:uncharacterized membrane protein YidH (DUF202 family)
MNRSKMPELLIIIGIILIMIGMLTKYTSLLNFLGRLPGDIRIEREGFRFYFPITTMILVSIIISIILRIFRK